jgi:single-stranded-DNA-specific exonuclease
MIQTGIVREAREQVLDFPDDSILFLGGDWHPGVVGIAASKLTEENWRPTWLFQRKDGICKGSARSIKGFDVTEAMMSCGHLFTKFGGHAAAGGFSFPEVHESEIRSKLVEFAQQRRIERPEIWESRIEYDCDLPKELLGLDIMNTLDELRPFGHCFEEPRFKLSLDVRRIQYFFDKVTGDPKHTCVIAGVGSKEQKILFFNEVITEIVPNRMHDFIVSLSRNSFRGVMNLSIMGVDWSNGEAP